MRAAVPIVLLSLVGCFGTEETPFPPGLGPLEEENRATAPAPEGDEAYPETLRFVGGEAESHQWGHARGYLHAPVERVAEALLTPEVVVNRREVDRFTVTRDVEPDYPHSYRLRNEVDDVISIWFDLTWRFGDGAGGRFLGRWQKTDGSTVITLNRGSIVLEPVDGGVSSIALIQHFDALRGGVDLVERYQLDLFASIRADVHDEPLPSY